MAIVNTSGTPIVRADLGEAYKEYVMAPETYIGVRVLGSYPVARKAAKWPKVLREQYLRAAEGIVRAAGAHYSRGKVKTEDLFYQCKERGREEKLPHEERALYASEYDAEMVTTEEAVNKVVLNQEIAIAAMIFDGTTNFTVGNGRRTDVTTAWALPAADIIGDVVDAVEKVRQRTGMDADTLVIGKAVIPYFLKNTAIRDAIKYTELAGVEAIKRSLSALFGLEKILIGGGVQNTANDGATPVISDIWSPIWASVCKTASPGDSLARPSLGRTLFWTNDADTESALVEEYEEAQTRSTIYRARSNAAEIFTDLGLAQLLDIAA